jgi:two-component sensor histidine kinase
VLKRFMDHVGRIWRFGLRPGSLASYLFVMACVAAATLIMAAVDIIRPDTLTHATYYPAILLATLIGGAWAGLLALTLGGIIAWWFFEPLYFGLLATEHTDLALYLGSSLVIVWAAEKYRRVVRKLDEEEHYRRLVVDELGHRLKNKLANVYAILGYELKDHPEIWAKVDGRLRALAVTDDFVANSDRQSARIDDILNAELAPYSISRVTLVGEPIPLPSKLAVTLALIFHELATNAAKYGALSTRSGRLHISWFKVGSQMTVEWVESGGPPTTTPFRDGFGKRLLERGLDPFHGKVEPQFGPDGLVSKITFSVPDREEEPGPASLEGSPGAQKRTPQLSRLV